MQKIRLTCSLEQAGLMLRDGTQRRLELPMRRRRTGELI
jgi:hypothetical protein